jgi:hypothetical protein
MIYMFRGQNIVGKTLILPAWLVQRLTQSISGQGIGYTVTYCGHTAYIKVG